MRHGRARRGDPRRGFRGGYLVGILWVHAGATQTHPGHPPANPIQSQYDAIKPKGSSNCATLRICVRVFN